MEFDVGDGGDDGEYNVVSGYKISQIFLLQIAIFFWMDSFDRVLLPIFVSLLVTIYLTRYMRTELHH